MSARPATARGTNGRSPRNGISSSSGSRQIRIPAELQAWATMIATSQGMTLTEFVQQSVQKEVDRHLLRGGPELVSTLETMRQAGNGNGQRTP